MIDGSPSLDPGRRNVIVAKAVAHDLAPAFENSIYFFDLAALGDESLMPSTVAAALGLESGGQDPITAIINYVRDGRVLFVLDSCEHMDRIHSEFAEFLFVVAPGIHRGDKSRNHAR